MSAQPTFDEILADYGVQDFIRTLSRVENIPALRLFISLNDHDRSEVAKVCLNRSRKRRALLELACEGARKVRAATQERLEELDWEIAQNDEWFWDVKDRKVVPERGEVQKRRVRAGELWHEQKDAKERLKRQSAEFEAATSELNLFEEREPSFRKVDLELAISPFYEEHQRQLRERKAAIVWERRKLQEEQDRLIRERLERERQEWERVEAERENERHQRLIADLAERERLRKAALAAQSERQRLERVERIRGCVSRRKISTLVHFTPLPNLASIMERGLLSRSSMVDGEYIYTDGMRLDGWLDYISLSVSFPNYKMLFIKSQQMSDIQDWAILEIDPAVVWELPCKFFISNAAGFAYSGDSDDLEDLFLEPEYRTNIPEHFTTDPQAEIMVHRKIPVDYFRAISVGSIRTNLPRCDLPVHVRPELFKYRSDYGTWQDGRRRRA